MQIILYSFTKKPNSTSQPMPSTGKMIDCTLKDNVSFMNPVLRFDPQGLVSGEFSPTIYNYCMIPYWERFYYITDWSYLNGCWEATLNSDVLASFKYEIGNTESYIIRSASDFNGSVMDSFYPATVNKSIQKIQINSDIYHTPLPSGCYVVGVVNSSDFNTKVGAVAYYAMTANELTQLIAFLFSENIYNESHSMDIGVGLWKSMFNPFQYFTSCMWFPYPATMLGSERKTINVGFWSSGLSATVVRNIVSDPITFTSDVPIPTHPQANRGEYLNHSPYTRVTAYCPPFGEIPVDTSFMQYGNKNYFRGVMYVDFITGIADCYFTITGENASATDTRRYFTMRTAQVGVPIQLSQIYNDFIAGANGLVGAIQSVAVGDIAGAFSNIANGLKESEGKVGNLGVNGSFLEIVEIPYLVIEHSRLVEENNAEFGRPLCENRLIGSLSGYIKCGIADHSFSGTKQENEMINQFLIDGFYYE